MKAVTLQQSSAAQGEQQQTTCGRSLSSNYAPLSLENKILSQTSTVMSQPCSPLLNFAAQPSSCPSLQPSSLSSTSSSLLSTSSLSPSLTSPLLSTENKLLESHPPLSSSLTCVPNASLLSTSLTSSALLNRFAHPPSSLHHVVAGEQWRDGDEVDGREETSEAMQSCFEEMSVTPSQVHGDLPLDKEQKIQEKDAGMKMSTSKTVFDNQEVEEALVIRQEEFAEVDKGDDAIKEELKDKKYLLLNEVCCSLVSKNTAPGQKDWDSEDSVWTRITNLTKDISVHDPEFLLKVAVYTRQQLNIRITANFLLALAASQPATKPHVRRYFCAAVQLPSDWLEVVRIYSTCFSRSLPNCLKVAMTDKFKQFSEYQLAKYNTRKHRCKHNRHKCKDKKTTDQQLKQWANWLRSDPSILKKFLQLQDEKPVDKKQSEFSMKKMLQKLHIKEPAEHVMGILGKKYPADMKTFTHSGLKGKWERERAGKRMKLKEPETWERLLSLEGNKAATWEKLIDNKSLPFMAMLRNLRNMITAGISEAHHKKILSRLTDKNAVIQSRQFPFRFLSAYKVIMELHNLGLSSEQQVAPAQEILKGILKNIPKSRRFQHQDWNKTPKGRIKVALGVPFVFRLYRKKRAELLKAKHRKYTFALLDRYRRALETAVQISCRHNVPPLPGRTVIFLPTCMGEDKPPNLDFCLPPDPEQSNDEEKKESEESGRKTEKITASLLEIGVLLSLMIGSCSEDCQLYISDWNGRAKVKLESDVLLDNVRSVMKQIEAHGNDEEDEEKGKEKEKPDKSTFFTLFTKKNKVDNIIMINDNWGDHNAEYMVDKYRREINNKVLVLKLFLLTHGGRDYPRERNSVCLRGFSEQILRFVAERGSSRLLDHVEHIDKLYNIPPPEGAKSPQATNSVVPLPAVPKLRWRSVRVFVSSTFRDMHAERDMLVRSVFPELRRRAASRCLYLQEVELRWGVTEEESERATELCLSEVCRSQMMVGILGQRYGLVPPRPVLPDLPQHSWLASAPSGLSITEMEIRQFQALYPDTVHQRMFCYFRDPDVIKSVPVAWRSDFVPESKEAESKMAALKRLIQTSDVKVTENYPCEWGGVVDGKPYLKNLQDFGKAVLEDLWMAVVKQFVNEEEEDEAVSDVREQEVHQEALQRQFFGRVKQLVGAVEMVEQIQVKGGMMVVEGGPGEGKTVFMAALADTLRTGLRSKTHSVCDVISYSTAASQSARSVENLLRCLVQWMRKMTDSEEESPLPHSYKDLLSHFHSALTDMKKKKALVLLVDGVDLVQDGRGQLSSDWIPQQLPQGVCLVVSSTSKAALFQTLVKKKSTVLFGLGQLSMLDRKEIVQKGLESFGKKLSDSAFNNQLQMLTMKKGAVSPLYLHVACEDLRNFASFDKLKESLQALPQSLGQLVQHSLDRLCSQYRGLLGLRWALAALTVSSTGLRERDLYSVLNTCNELSSQNPQLTWQQVLHLSRKPRGRVPMATFSHIVQSLQSLIGQSRCHNTDDLLIVSSPEVRTAFEDFLLPAESDRSRAHLVLAAHLWALADQQGPDTFLHCEANSVMHLPSSLIQSDQLEPLHSLLCSYYFLFANVRHGLLHHLLEIYTSYDEKMKSAASIGVQGPLEDCRRFLQRHALLLSSWPNLFLQQARNEPPDSSAHTWAQGLMGNGGVRVVEWLNNDHQLEESSELVSTFSSEPTCLVLSSDGKLMVVGTGQGTLHFISTQTGQEVKSLVSSCDGISSCVLLKDGRLATTSFDGRIEMWDMENGCRTSLINAHTNAVTASDITADRKHLVTVSLDSTLKVWSSAKGHEVASLLSSSPLNCVTFDPEDHLLAAGCWSGDVIVWNWLQNKTQTSLCGHQRSVRSLCFSSSSSMLCSGSVSGEVRVWSVPTSTCVGCFQAHYGATDALSFINEGRMLLSAGADHTLQLWSGGLGRSVSTLKNDEFKQELPLKKQSLTSDPGALCVAVNGDRAAVGYHGDGFKLFSLNPAEQIWSSNLDVSVLCLLWVVVQDDQMESELLVSSGSDKHLRVWKSKEGELGMLGGLEMVGMFAGQTGVVLALAQNSTYLATASEDFTIALWLLSDLVHDSLDVPQSLLRGHSGGVTCLAFSPDGEQLLSGGKDQALMLWDVSVSPALLSQSLPHSHRDWITSCVWTPHCVISSSNDGRLCFWDLQAGQCLREISWGSPLTSLCCGGPYVMAGCAEGALHVWTWETSVEICHIAAHKQRIHHCSLLPPTEVNKENPDELTVFTASDDGSVKLWKPLQVEHFKTFHGHTGAVCAAVGKEGVQEFLTVSEDCCLRCWTWTAGRGEDASSVQRRSVTALCFSLRDSLLLVGYESGLVELWQHNRLVGHKQTSDSVTAICSMPDSQFAVGYIKPAVDVFKLAWNQQHSTASLLKVNTYEVENPVIRLHYCSLLIGVSCTGNIFSVTADDEDKWHYEISSWFCEVKVLELIKNDEKSMWLLGENDGEVNIGFMFAMGPKYHISRTFGSMNLKSEDAEKTGRIISAVTMNEELVVFGDMRGTLWFNQPPEISTWSNRKLAHSDRISVLKLTDRTIISASYDRTVKMWDRNTKKQVGMFVCEGPVLHLELNPAKPSELVCGDAQGKIYFLSRKE
ncbi:uncharacterized protein V6R79_026311 [Siganus canaliculatus]